MWLTGKGKIMSNIPHEKEQAIRHVLGHFRLPGGYQGGGFTEALLTTIGKADLANRELLRLGFPNEVWAMNKAQNEEGGVAELTALLP